MRSYAAEGLGVVQLKGAVSMADAQHPFDTLTHGTADTQVRSVYRCREAKVGGTNDLLTLAALEPGTRRYVPAEAFGGHAVLLVAVSASGMTGTRTSIRACWMRGGQKVPHSLLRAARGLLVGRSSYPTDCGRTNRETYRPCGLSAYPG